MLPVILLFPINYRKNRITPITLTTEPIISLAVILCFNKKIDGGIINIGTIAIIVEAIPVEVY